MDVFEELANAIVLQAVKDYRSALKTLKRNPNYPKAVYMKQDCERFFSSGWFEELTSIDGKLLMKKLKQEANYYDD